MFTRGEKMKFLIKAGLGGGFGGVDMLDGEIYEFETRESAEEMAYVLACDEYSEYEGLHGLRDIEQIMEEDGIDDYDEAVCCYEEERESWLDWSVEEIKE